MPPSFSRLAHSLLLVAGFALSAAGWVSRQTPSVESPPTDPLARVHGEPISRAEYGDYLVETFGAGPLRGLILRRLVQAEARRLDIAVDEARIEAQVEEIWQGLGERARGQPEQIGIHLRTQGFSAESYRRLVETNLRHEQRVEAICRATREVSEERLRAAFEETHGPGGVRIEVRHIFLDSRRVESELENPTPAGVRAELTRRIDEYRAALQAGADFAELARLHSHDTRSAEQGGVLVRSARAEFGATFVAALEEAAVGLPRGPVFSTRGAHLVEVTSRVTTQFEDVREELLRQLREAPATREEMRALEQRLDRPETVEELWPDSH